MMVFGCHWGACMALGYLWLVDINCLFVKDGYNFAKHGTDSFFYKMVQTAGKAKLFSSFLAG